MRLSFILLFVVLALSASVLNAQTVLIPNDTLVARNFINEPYHYIPGVLSSPFADINGDGKLDFKIGYGTNNPETSYFGDVSAITGISYFDEDISSDHDIIVNYGMRPAGDLNADGFDDFILYQLEYTDSTSGNKYYIAFNSGNESVIGDEILPQSDISDPRNLSLNTSSITGTDFNGDGFQDILTFKNKDTGFEVLFGNSGINGITNTFYWNAIDYNFGGEYLQFSELAVGDIDNNGTLEITIIGGYRSPEFNSVTMGDSYDLMVKTYQIKEDKSLTQLDSAVISIDKYFNSTGQASWGFGPTKTESWFTDIDHDGRMELLISGYYSLSGVAIYLDSDSVSSLFNKAEWLILENPLSEVDERLLGYSELKVIGDYNGDGNDDIYWSSGDERVYLSSVNSDTLLINNINLVEETGGSDYQFDFFGDINGDGFDDIRMDIEGGFRFYLGNEEMSFSEYFEPGKGPGGFESSYDAFSLFKVKDLDKDGIDDFGLVKERSIWNTVSILNQSIEIFLSGGNDLDTKVPGIVIENTDYEYIDYPVTGDFNGDGDTDLAVNYSTTLKDEEKTALHIYYGATGSIDDQADLILDINELFPGLNDHSGFRYLKNIGDLNGDGMDDLIFSVDRVKNETAKSFVLLGGENQTNGWDIEIPFWGSDFENIGDINGDDIPEIAISSPSFGWIPSDNTHNSEFAQGKIALYSWYNENEGGQFDTTSVFELTHPKLDFSEGNLSGFGQYISSGDFNGDGETELLVQVGSHTTPYPYKGLELVYLYTLGSSADSLPEASFKIPYENLQNNIYSGSNYDDEFILFDISVTAIKDLNGDGMDEILVETGFYDYPTNALLYPGTEDLESLFDQEPYVFYAPNQFTHFGTGDNGYFERRNWGAATVHFEPVYGNFSGTDVNSFLFYQNGLKEFVSPPVYKYDLFKVPVHTEKEDQPSGFALDQNYPNPFNPTTNISYSLGRTSEVKLEIFNVLGQKVQTLVDERKNPGTYRITFDARNLSSGMYFYKLSTSGFTQTKKMVLIK